MHMASLSRPALTAEWQCTRCAVTNRKLVLATTREIMDTCMHCGLRHIVRPDSRPVRWRAEAT